MKKYISLKKTVNFPFRQLSSGHEGPFKVYIGYQTTNCVEGQVEIQHLSNQLANYLYFGHGLDLAMKALPPVSDALRAKRR